MTDPVVPVDDRRDRYVVTNPAGQTEFFYTFDLRLGDGVVPADEIAVYVDDVEVAFTIDAVLKKITLDVGAAEDAIVVLEGKTKSLRQNGYPLRGGLPSSQMNNEVNQLFYLIQELTRNSVRSMQLPKSAADNVSTLLPTLVADRALLVNSSATGFIMGPTAAEITNAQANAESVAIDKALTVAAKDAAIAAKDAAETAAASLVLPLNNWLAVTDPTVDDDVDAGYSPNSKWYNTASGEIFNCVNSADGAAVWITISFTLDEVTPLLAAKADLNTTVVEKTDSYTLQATDNGKLLEANKGTALTFTVNASLFTAGQGVAFLQTGAGQLTIAAGAGVTINTAETLKLRKQRSAAYLHARSATVFDLIGDLEAI
jgi:hypothetical protein